MQYPEVNPLGEREGKILATLASLGAVQMLHLIDKQFLKSSEKHLLPAEHTTMLTPHLYASEGPEAASYVVSATATPSSGRRRCYWHGQIPGNYFPLLVQF